MSNFVVTWDESGHIARTFNYLANVPTWESIQSGLSGDVNDGAYDWQSAYITSGYTSGALGMYVVTTSGTTLRVYYSSDVRAETVSWSLQVTFTMNDSTVTSGARIVSSRTQVDFVIVAWKDRTGTQVARTTDGVNWGSAVQVGSAITDLVDNDNKPIGLAVDGVKQLVTAPDSTEKYFVYLATSTGGSFSKLTGSPSSDSPSPMITTDNQGRAYAVGDVSNINDEIGCGDNPCVDCSPGRITLYSVVSQAENFEFFGGTFGTFASRQSWQLPSGATFRFTIDCACIKTIKIRTYNNIADTYWQKLIVTVKGIDYEITHHNASNGWFFNTITFRLPLRTQSFSVRKGSGGGDYIWVDAVEITDCAL